MRIKCFEQCFRLLNILYDLIYKCFPFYYYCFLKLFHSIPGENKYALIRMGLN